ncbi:Chloride channel protein CLC-c, partial [Mucuna pruriens]
MLFLLLVIWRTSRSISTYRGVTHKGATFASRLIMERETPQDSYARNAVAVFRQSCTLVPIMTLTGEGSKKMDEGGVKCGDYEHDIENEGLLDGNEEIERYWSGLSDRNMDDTKPLLVKRVNTTSQIAIVGANLCPIESLDYEMRSIREGMEALYRGRFFF